MSGMRRCVVRLCIHIVFPVPWWPVLVAVEGYGDQSSRVRTSCTFGVTAFVTGAA